MIDIYAGILTLLAIIVVVACYIALKRTYMEERAKLHGNMVETIRRIKSEYDEIKRKEGARTFAEHYDLNQKIKTLETELQQSRDKFTKMERKYSMLLKSLEDKNGQG